MSLYSLESSCCSWNQLTFAFCRKELSFSLTRYEHKPQLHTRRYIYMYIRDGTIHNSYIIYRCCRYSQPHPVARYRPRRLAFELPSFDECGPRPLPVIHPFFEL